MNTIEKAQAARTEFEQAKTALNESHESLVTEIITTAERRVSMLYLTSLREGAIARSGVRWPWACIVLSGLRLFLKMAALMPPSSGESAAEYHDRLDKWIGDKWRNQTP
jgi:hypothetical protein